jgi:hypothetical protein
VKNPRKKEEKFRKSGWVLICPQLASVRSCQNQRLVIKLKQLWFSTNSQPVAFARRGSNTQRKMATNSDSHIFSGLNSRQDTLFDLNGHLLAGCLPLNKQMSLRNLSIENKPRKG